MPYCHSSGSWRQLWLGLYPFFSSHISVLFYLSFNFHLLAAIKGSAGGAPPSADKGGGGVAIAVISSSSQCEHSKNKQQQQQWFLEFDNHNRFHLSYSSLL